MNFLAPAAFALSALLPIILAFYFLKLRREEVRFSSTYLWQELVRDTAANAPWQRLRLSWLLILQLLFLVLLMLALARPFTWTRGTTGNALILVVDTSASMGARDLAPNRLAEAARQARRLIETLPVETRVTLVIAGDTAQVLLAGSTDRGQIFRALESLQPGLNGADMASAMELATALATGEGDAEIVILSDGGVKLPERVSTSAALRYIPIGQSAENQAIAALALTLENAGQNVNAFVRVTNYGAANVKRRLTLTAYTQCLPPTCQGLLVAARDLDLPAGGAQSLNLNDLPPETLAVQARLEGEDDLALDDVAWAVTPVIAGAQVQIVGPGNRFLEAALGLLPGVEMTRITLDAYEQSWSTEALSATEASNTWLTIFDSVLPEPGHYPPGALAFIAPLRSTEFFSVTGELELPAPVPASSAEPLLRYVDLSDVVIARAARMPLPAWGRPVIVANQAGDGAYPLLAVGEIGGRRLAVLAFDPRESDLPLRVAYPLLWAHLVEYLAPGTGSALPLTALVGQPLDIPLPPQAQALRISTPDGKQTRLALTPDQSHVLFQDTAAFGLYEVNWEDEKGTAYLLGRFAITPFNIQEAVIAPRAELPLGAGDGNTVPADRAVPREWWRPLAWAGLLILVVEWLVQYRGHLAWLWARLQGREAA